MKTTDTLAPLDRSARATRRARRLTLIYGPKGSLAPVIAPIEDRLIVGRDAGPGGFSVPDDSSMSRAHFELSQVPEYGVLRIQDLGSKNKLWVDGKAVDRAFLPGGSVLRAGGCLFVVSELATDADKWIDPIAISRPDRADPRISLARSFAEQVADQVAKADVSVLIQGPSGAGKEGLAQRIHDGAPRTRKMLSVNCGAFNRELLAAELFGYVQGIHSTAMKDHAGLFEEASGGTLFLDEIGDMPIEQQPLLLRVLQERKVRRIGGSRDYPVDVRVIAATHQDLGALVEEGRFRGDLLARLAGVRLRLPGLSERREEILSLLSHFLGPSHAPLTLNAAERLALYSWPYNVREVREVANTLRIMPRLEEIDSAVLPHHIATTGEARDGNVAPSRAQLEDHLRRVGGNITRLAEELGEHRTQVRRWLDAHGLDGSNYRVKEKKVSK